MKVIAVLALCIAGALAAPSSYGQPDIRVIYDAPVVKTISTYEAPALKMTSYEAPVVKASYDAYAAPVVLAHIPIVKHHYSADDAGNFNLDVETGNGIKKSETGTLKQFAEGPAVVKSGSYSFTSDDGKTYTVSYTADENGFHPTGSHLPTPPPMPEEIAKSLALPRIPEYQDGYVAPTVVRTSSYAAPALRTSYNY